jgi:hypothetical protein
MEIWEREVKPNLNPTTGVFSHTEDSLNSVCDLTSTQPPKPKRVKSNSETNTMDKEIDASYSGMNILCTAHSGGRE